MMSLLFTRSNSAATNVVIYGGRGSGGGFWEWLLIERVLQERFIHLG